MTVPIWKTGFNCKDININLQTCLRKSSLALIPLELCITGFEFISHLHLLGQGQSRCELVTSEVNYCMAVITLY